MRTTEQRAVSKINRLNFLASISFFTGSTLFLPQFANYATVGVYLFMLGSALMFVDTIKSKY